MVEIPDVQSWFPPLDYPQIPNVGWEAQYNALVDFWNDPCEAPWRVYLELALPLLGSMLALILTPSPGEILENLVMPRRYSGCWRNRREKRAKKGSKITPKTGRHFRQAIPDIDDLIADLIPGREALEVRNVGVSGSLFAMSWQIVDRLAWQLMLIDMLGNGFYAWHSALLETEWCQASAKQVAKTYDTEWHNGVVEEIMIVPQIGPKEARNGGDAGIDGVHMTRNHWRALFVADIDGTSAEPAVGVLYWLNEEMEVVDSRGFTLAIGETVNFTMRKSFLNPGAVHMGLKVSAGAVFIHGTMLWAEQVG